MSDITTKAKKSNGSGILGSLSNGFYIVLVYGMLFVSLMLVTGKEITINVLTIPALLLFLVVRAAEYFVTSGGKKDTPQWIKVGAFVVAVLTAIGMTTIF